MFDLYTLNNGLRVVTEYIEHVNSISVGVMYQNGSRNETEEVNGISHFIEHMFFKGTNKRTAKDIVQDIENIGGQINAYTSKENTCYYIKALDTHLDLSLEVLSDMLLNAKFDSEEIEKEKGVVIEEINMTEDSPEEVLDDIHSQVIFGNNSLAYPILGTINKVKSFNRDKIIDYIDNHYTPKNTVISICGKFDGVELRKKLEHYFGSWVNKSKYNLEYPVPELQYGSIATEKQIEQLHIQLGLKGLPYDDPKGSALVLLNNYFGGGASSILFQKVREELGLCYSIFSFHQPHLGVGTFNIYTGLSKQFAGKALECISTELQDFCKVGLSKKELEINKEKIKASYILGLESTSSRMFSNAKSVLLRNKLKTQQDVIDRINKIDENDINYVVETCFKPGIISTAYVGNEVNKDELDAIINTSIKSYDTEQFSTKNRI